MVAPVMVAPVMVVLTGAAPPGNAALCGKVQAVVFSLTQPVIGIVIALPSKRCKSAGAIVVVRIGTVAPIVSSADVGKCAMVMTGAGVVQVQDVQVQDVLVQDAQAQDADNSFAVATRRGGKTYCTKAPDRGKTSTVPVTLSKNSPHGTPC